MNELELKYKELKQRLKTLQSYNADDHKTASAISISKINLCREMFDVLMEIKILRGDTK